MKKKTIVFGLLILNILIMTSILMSSFSVQSEESLTKGKIKLTFLKPNSKSNKEALKQIYETANRYNIDLLLEYYNEKGELDYYYIYKTPESWQMDLQGGKLEEGIIYSTKPQRDERKIYGIFYETYTERLVPFEKISEIKDINLSTVSIWIPSKYKTIYSQLLTKMGYEESNRQGGVVYDENINLKILLAVMTLFFLLSVVIYSFSRNSEYSICKTQGYSPFDILRMEYKEIIIPSIMIIGIESLCITVFLSSIYNLGTAGVFFLKNGSYYILLYGIFFVIFSLAVIYVYSIVGILDIKGKNLNRFLIGISAVLKLLALVIICINLSQITIQVKELFKDIEMYSNSKKMFDGIADLHFSNGTRDIGSNEKYIAERFLDFLENTDDVFVMELAYQYDFESSDEEMKKIMSPEEYSKYLKEKEDWIDSGKISVGYLNINEIYLPDGRRLTSDMIDVKKNNFLVPEGYDYSEGKEQFKKYFNMDANFIYYDSDSKFYAFDPTLARRTLGVEDRLYLEIINPDWYRQRMITDPEAEEEGSVTEMMGWTYFTYDKDSELSAYEQIYDSVNKYDLTPNMFEASAVSQIFYEGLYGNIKYSIGLITNSIIYIISYLILLFYAISLLINNHTREIIIKIREGYSFINIFWLHIFLLAYQVPVLILASIRWNINIWIALSAIVVDILLFILMSNRIVKKKNLAKLEAIK